MDATNDAIDANTNKIWFPLYGYAPTRNITRPQIPATRVNHKNPTNRGPIAQNI